MNNQKINYNNLFLGKNVCDEKNMYYQILINIYDFKTMK